MRLPDGRLVRSRVVEDPRTVLVDALDRELTGYAVLEPRDSLLFDGTGSAVLTFRAGVPVVAYHTGTNRGGPPALADLAAAGPYRLDLYAVAADALAPVHDRDAFRVPPGLPARRLAGDQSLADRTRGVAPADRLEGGDDDADDVGGVDSDGSAGAVGASASARDQVGAVEAFLDDEEKIEAIRERARAEAKERAQQWGFDDVTDA